jgi:hypothetical protein
MHEKVTQRLGTMTTIAVIATKKLKGNQLKELKKKEQATFYVSNIWISMCRYLDSPSIGRDVPLDVRVKDFQIVKADISRIVEADISKTCALWGRGLVFHLVTRSHFDIIINESHGIDA